MSASAPTQRTEASSLASGVRGGYLNLIVGWIVQALLVPLLLGKLGRDAYGLYATLTSVVGYFTLLTFGSGLTIPRYVADHSAKGEAEELSTFASTYAVLHVAALTIGVVAGWLLTPLVATHLIVPAGLKATIAPAWRLVVVTWALGLGAGLAQSFLIGLADVALANLVNSARTLLTLAVAAAILAAGGGLSALLAGLLAVSLAGSALAFVVLRRRHPELRIALGLARLATVRATAGPAGLFFLMQVAALVVTGTDNVIISVFLGVGQVTPYAVAFQLWSLALAVLWSGADALMPFYTRWDAGEEQERLRHAYVGVTRYSFAGSVLAAIVIAAFGDTLVRWWIGSGVVVPRGVLLTFAGMLLTATPIHTAALVLSALGKHRPVALGGAAEAALNLGLSLALVRPLGVLGVALGTLISGVLTNAWIAPLWAARATHLVPAAWARRSLLPAALPAAVAGGAALLLRAKIAPGSPELVIAIAGLMVVFVSVFWLGGMDASDRQEVRALVHR